VGVWFGAGAADDDFYSVTDCIDEAAITRGESDGEQIGLAGFAEGECVAFGVGGEAATEVAVEGFVVCQFDSWGLAVKSDPADAAFFAQNGAANFMIAVGAGGGGGLGEAEGELDPFIFHERDLFFRYVQAVENAVKDGCQNDAEEGDEDDSREEGVRGGKKFGRDSG
jgi:hypothetical protein